ncbi:hypothetical protein DPEC_G00160800 [Dallia pectoralis]|uniref:Uncharacterized protein n=1 Tax=Dallia pectoralis TaxID=75939 RepID=A0ACC2GGG1_DALPE|nr:hypothetical protein DPEC_G00160800 [Dallia pectoralis]
MQSQRSTTGVRRQPCGERVRLTWAPWASATSAPWSLYPTFNTTLPGFSPDIAAQPTIFPRSSYSIVFYLLLVNKMFSVFNNTLVMTVLVKSVALLNPMNVILLSLAVSGFG